MPPVPGHSGKYRWEEVGQGKTRGLQVVQREAYRGGSAKWREKYRFKHLATDLYLTVVQMNAPVKPSGGGRRQSLLQMK